MTERFLNLKIVEGISGYYFYHLSESGKSGHPTLCGIKNVMNTSVPLKSWGIKSHIGERYCKDCERIAKDNDRKTS